MRLTTGRTLDLNDRAYFKQVRTSTEPVFEAVFGRLTGVAVLPVAYPARDNAGELKYVLLASLNSRSLPPASLRQLLNPTWKW